MKLDSFPRFAFIYIVKLVSYRAVLSLSVEISLNFSYYSWLSITIQMASFLASCIVFLVSSFFRFMHSPPVTNYLCPDEN